MILELIDNGSQVYASISDTIVTNLGLHSIKIGERQVQGMFQGIKFGVN